MTTIPSTAVVVYDPDLVDSEHVALAGFLGGYRGLTRDAYALDLRQFVAFCEQRYLALFEVRRSDIETFGRELEGWGRATATIARRLCTVTGFYRYAEEEGLIAHSPAVHVRRPRIDYESHAIGLDRNEVGALLVAAGLGPAAEHALISLLALNGLRVSEAIGADIEALAVERGHRTLTAVRKGGKTVTIPLAPRTARAVDLAVGDLHHHRRPAARSSRGHPDRPPCRPEGPGRQADRPAHPPPRLHHRCPRCGGAAPRCARGGVARRPPNHYAVRPGEGLTRSPRYLHSVHLHRRRDPLTWRSGRERDGRWPPEPSDPDHSYRRIGFCCPRTVMVASRGADRPVLGAGYPVDFIRAEEASCNAATQSDLRSRDERPVLNLSVRSAAFWTVGRC
jgi:hypothetical protein